MSCACLETVEISVLSLDDDGLPPWVLPPHVDNPVGLSLMKNISASACCALVAYCPVILLSK